MPHRRLWAMILLAGCSHRPTVEATPVADAGAQKPPIDRLSPDELAQSTILVFGFPIPQGMTVERRYSNSIHLVGTVSPTALTAYVRAHAVTGPAELIGHRKVFDKVRIKGGDPNRLYTIEIDESGSSRHLIVSDITPPPAEPNLTVEERWRRAGYLPDGTPIPSAHTL